MVCSLQLPYSTHITDEETKTQREYLIYSQKHKLGLKYSNSWFANPGSWILFYIQCITFLIYNFFFLHLIQISSFNVFNFLGLATAFLISSVSEWVALDSGPKKYCESLCLLQSSWQSSYWILHVRVDFFLTLRFRFFGNQNSNLFLFQFCFVFFLSFFFKCYFHLQVLIYTSLLSCQLFTPTFRYTGYYHIFLNNFLHGIKMHIYIVKPT